MRLNVRSNCDFKLSPCPGSLLWEERLLWSPATCEIIPSCSSSLRRVSLHYLLAAVGVAAVGAAATDRPLLPCFLYYPCRPCRRRTGCLLARLPSTPVRPWNSATSSSPVPVSNLVCLRLELVKAPVTEMMAAGLQLRSRLTTLPVPENHGLRSTRVSVDQGMTVQSGNVDISCPAGRFVLCPHRRRQRQCLLRADRRPDPTSRPGAHDPAYSRKITDCVIPGSPWIKA